MTAPRPKEDPYLSVAAARLARNDRVLWDGFVTAFHQYVEARLGDLVSSSVDTLQVAQGRAQNARDLARIFDDAMPAAANIEARARSTSR